MHSKTPEKTGQSICAFCHEQGGGCCRLGTDGTARMFGLTKGEVEFIARASGREPKDFVTADEVSPEFLADLAAIHPVFLQTLPQGRRLRLSVNEQGDCVFLGPGGCTLPVEGRPLYCRLYPFWFTPGGQLMVLISGNCLAQRDARSWRDVLAKMGESREHLRGLFARLETLAKDHQRAEAPERLGE